MTKQSSSQNHHRIRMSTLTMMMMMIIPYMLFPSCTYSSLFALANTVSRHHPLHHLPFSHLHQLQQENQEKNQVESCTSKSSFPSPPLLNTRVFHPTQLNDNIITSKTSSSSKMTCSRMSYSLNHLCGPFLRGGADATAASNGVTVESEVDDDDISTDTVANAVASGSDTTTTTTTDSIMGQDDIESNHVIGPNDTMSIEESQVLVVEEEKEELKQVNVDFDMTDTSHDSKDVEEDYVKADEVSHKVDEETGSTTSSHEDSIITEYSKDAITCDMDENVVPEEVEVTLVIDENPADFMDKVDRVDGGKDSEEGNDGIGEANMDYDKTCTSQEGEQDICSEEPTLLSIESVSSMREVACKLRVEGKQHHDEGNFTTAAQTFHDAAMKLEDALRQLSNEKKQREETSYQENEEEEYLYYTQSSEMVEECATCHLHEALCHLKRKDYEECIQSCTSVLLDEYPGENDDSTISHSDVSDDETNIESSVSQDEDETVSNPINTNAVSNTSPMKIVPLTPAIRARAYHRRAKARLALGDTFGALEDSRNAAFLGEKKAVAMYGRLMRSSSTSEGDNSMMIGGDATNSAMEQMLSSAGSSSSSPLNSLLSNFGGVGTSDGVQDEGESKLSGGSPSLDILNAFMDSSKKSNLATDGDDETLSSAIGGGGGGMTDLLFGGRRKQKDSSLVKSVLQSVTKRIEDRESQERLCTFLQSVNKNQIMMYASMAGMPLTQTSADRLVRIANGITPKLLSKTVRRIKGLIKVGKVLQKFMKLMGEYRHVLILLVLMAWIKSAILRPIVVKQKRK